MLVIKQLVAMLGFYVFTFCIANSASIIAEESRFETWQQGRPFTIGAMYYDGPYGPPAQLPVPEGAQPEMAIFRYAGLNMLDEVSWSMSVHELYPFYDSRGGSTGRLQRGDECLSEPCDVYGH